MDCLRTAKRLGAEEVICVYRRTRNESPARKEELEHAEEEQIDFRWLSAPLAILGNDEGFVTGMRIQRMEFGAWPGAAPAAACAGIRLAASDFAKRPRRRLRLRLRAFRSSSLPSGAPATLAFVAFPARLLGEPDASGRRRPVPIEGSEYEIAIDTAVIAIGQGPNPLATKSTPGLELNRHGNIVADEKTLMTSIPGVFAGGDIVTGAATVILAMGAGKQAALGIQDWLARLARGEVAKPELPAA